MDFNIKCRAPPSVVDLLTTEQGIIQQCSRVNHKTKGVQGSDRHDSYKVSILVANHIDTLVFHECAKCLSQAGITLK